MKDTPRLAKAVFRCSCFSTLLTMLLLLIRGIYGELQRIGIFIVLFPFSAIAPIPRGEEIYVPQFLHLENAPLGIAVTLFFIQGLLLTQLQFLWASLFSLYM